MDINESVELELSQPEQHARLMKAYQRIAQEVKRRKLEQSTPVTSSTSSGTSFQPAAQSTAPVYTQAQMFSDEVCNV